MVQRAYAQTNVVYRIVVLLADFVAVDVHIHVGGAAARTVQINTVVTSTDQVAVDVHIGDDTT